MKKIIQLLTVCLMAIVLMVAPATTKAATPTSKTLCLTTSTANAGLDAPPLALCTNTTTGTINLYVEHGLGYNVSDKNDNNCNTAAIDIGNVTMSASTITNVTGYNNSGGNTVNSTGWNNKADATGYGYSNIVNTTGWTKVNKTKNATVNDVGTTVMAMTNTTTAKTNDIGQGVTNYSNTSANTKAATKNDNGTITVATNYTAHPNGCECMACGNVTANNNSGGMVTFTIRV